MLTPVSSSNSSLSLTVLSKTYKINAIATEITMPTIAPKIIFLDVSLVVTDERIFPVPSVNMSLLPGSALISSLISWSFATV